MLPVRLVHVLLPEGQSPPAEIDGAPVVEAWRRSVRTAADVRDALALHTTDRDYPGPRDMGGYADRIIGRDLAHGRPYVQHRLTLPDRDAEAVRGPETAPDPLPPGALVVGVDSLAALMGVSRRRARYALDHGLVRTLRSTALRGRESRYAYLGTPGAPDALVAEWAGRYAQLIPVLDLAAPRSSGGRAWFSPSHVAAAIVAGEIAGTDAVCAAVYTDAAWLLWAASRQPAGSLASILSSQTR